MTFFALALVVSIIGILPLVIGRQFALAAVVAVAGTAFWGFTYWLFLPSLVWPLWGMYGFSVLVLWVCSAFLASAAQNDLAHIPALFPAAGLVVFTVVSLSGCPIFQSVGYSAMLGDVEAKEWTQDIQPKDPKHVRLVSPELAAWLADKQLGEAEGAIGSQFTVAKDYAMIQIVRGELWYVFPLDFKEFSVWTSVDAAPGYVMVHAEDPYRPVILNTGEKLVYTPGAFFGKNLERYLWNEGYREKGLTEFTLEVDDEGRPWWVVTVFEPTIAWSGEKTIGVVIVDPAAGGHQFYPPGKIPAWVDRVIPGEFVKNYIGWRGNYHAGWWNAFWAQKDVTEPEIPNVVYGADQHPYWVTVATSSNAGDESMVGVYYTSTQTGKTIFYRAVGVTDYAALQAVNNKVAFLRWHGSGPSLYNIYGVLTNVVPLLGENHTYQGVALVRVDNSSVVYAENAPAAFRKYQVELARSGEQVALDQENRTKTADGFVDRFASEVRGAVTIYYVHVERIPHLFTGESEPWHKLPMTQRGDRVRISYVESDEDVVPIVEFDNPSLVLEVSPNQAELFGRMEQRRESAETHFPA